ncbi:MAG: ATP-binding cassette domain-containing protein [Thermoplasmata archaeon]|nr:MAG: ATP-binding cassette domain-containing protein [Thermoplasmata archaeon]
MITVRNLTKEFKTITAVDDVSFEVRKGEIFGLLGPNGAGKTTTQRMLSTILRPTSGTINIMDVDVVKNPVGARSIIGVITEERGLYDRLSCRETLWYYGRLYNMEDGLIGKRIDQIVEMLEMGDYVDRRIEKLSKGMKQKIVIARAIIHDPPVLLFDEPTAGLDVLAARTVLKFIKMSKEMKKTILYSTHIMFEAEDLCDRVAFISKGKIVVSGTMKEAIGPHENLEKAFVKYVGAKKDEFQDN